MVITYKEVYISNEIGLVFNGIADCGRAVHNIAWAIEFESDNPLLQVSRYLGLAAIEEIIRQVKEYKEVKHG